MPCRSRVDPVVTLSNSIGFALPPTPIDPITGSYQYYDILASCHVRYVLISSSQFPDDGVRSRYSGETKTVFKEIFSLLKIFIEYTETRSDGQD